MSVLRFFAAGVWGAWLTSQSLCCAHEGSKSSTHISRASRLLHSRACVAECSSEEQAYASSSPETRPRVHLFSQRYSSYVLGAIIPLTADTALFRFLLPDPDDEFNLRPCSTLQVCYKYGVQPADQCHRFYTPVTPNGTKGYFDLIIKRRSDGQMTKHIFGMHVGDSLLLRSVAFKIQYRPNRWDHVGMIGGGTGFTPFVQIIRHALADSPGLQPTKRVADKTRLSFLFCNQTERHILLRGYFDDLAKKFPSRFRVFYSVDASLDKEKWLQEPNHYIGYVTKQMVQDSMPAPRDKRKIIMLCGPDELLNHVAGTPLSTMTAMSGGNSVQPMATDINNLVSLGGILHEMGYDSDDIYRF